MPWACPHENLQFPTLRACKAQSFLSLFFGLTPMGLPLPQCFWLCGTKLRPWSEQNSGQNSNHARLWIYQGKEKLRPWSKFLGRENSDHVVWISVSQGVGVDPVLMIGGIPCFFLFILRGFPCFLSVFPFVLLFCCTFCPSFFWEGGGAVFPFSFRGLIWEGRKPPLTLRRENQYLYFGRFFPCTPGPFSCSTGLFVYHSHRASPVLQEFGLVLRVGVRHSTSVLRPLPWG